MEYILNINNDSYYLQYKGDIVDALKYIDNCNDNGIWIKCLSMSKRKTLLNPINIISIEQKVKGEINIVTGEPIK
ncbi:hypothetical protein [Staphylococcus ureilyticus]|uniref:hypothetical protein n=1 Tax=Staphylococcus ureilyticus TaxID=94138 RepID=UPI0028FEDB84|nr:hypothetical protein [Staphylococcus ureilyticus]MDU0461938.1 hypothetical protein [Staphylococcus ureilyticus]